MNGRHVVGEGRREARPDLLRQTVLLAEALHQDLARDERTRQAAVVMGVVCSNLRRLAEDRGDQRR